MRFVIDLRAVTPVAFMLGCTLSVDDPEPNTLACSSNAACPNDLICNPISARCVSASSEIDTAPPEPTEVTVVDANTLVLAFDEALDAASASASGNYAIDGLGIREVAVAGSTSVRLATEPQAPERDYILRVRGVSDPDGNSIASAGVSIAFTGFGAIDRAPPELLSPSDGAIVLGNTARFFWSARSGATEFRVQVSAAEPVDGVFAEPVYDETFDASTTSVNVPLNRAQTYFWSVSSDVIESPADVARIEVLNDAIYVYCPAAAPACSDEGRAGNLSKPFQSISSGITAARANGIPLVRVAARGELAAYEESFTLTEGVSVLGGYAVDGQGNFSEVSDPDAHPTIVSASSTATVIAEGIATRPTVLDGLIIENSETSASQALVITDSSDALSVTHNTIRILGSAALGRRLSRAVVVSCSSEAVDQASEGPWIADNRIDAGVVSAFTGGFSVGLDCLRCPVRLSQNIIDGGRALSVGSDETRSERYETRGVNLVECVAALDANRVFSGVSRAEDTDAIDPTSTGLAIDYQSTALLSDGSVFVATNNEITAEGWGNVNAFRSTANEGGGGILANNTLVTSDLRQPNIALSINSETSLVNNLIVSAMSGQPVRVCIRGDTAPLALENNAFVGCTQLINITTEPSCDCGTGELECLVGCPGTVGANFEFSDGASVQFASFVSAARPQSRFQDNDYRLTEATPSAVKQAGKDLSAASETCDAAGQSCGPIASDIRGEPRTCPNPDADCFSLGAHEF